MIPEDETHLFIRGADERKTEDWVLERWIVHFLERDVPIHIASRDYGRRYLYKHQTRIKYNKLKPCCAHFDEAAEGRDLNEEMIRHGFLPPR